MTGPVVALYLEDASKLKVFERVNCDIILQWSHLCVVMRLLIPFKTMYVFVGLATTSFSRNKFAVSGY